jgi:hypothetical protein
MLEAVAVADRGEGMVAERLAAVGLHVLGRVLQAPSTRSQALPLLAADALITYACEAAVEEDVVDEVDPVGRLLDTLGLHSFVRTLDGRPTDG